MLQRARLAQALAFVAVIAALIGALGPAEHVRTSYTWPPHALPTGTPSDLWYTPLLLIRRQPESIYARVPCTLPPPLSTSSRRVIVLATARYAEPSGGLAVTQIGDQLAITIGTRLLGRVRLGTSGSVPRDCAYDLRIDTQRWAIDGGPDQIEQRGPLRQMPTVSGIFSALDLRSGPPPSIDITTTVHASRPTAYQKVGWTVAVVGALSALLLVTLRRRPRPRTIAAAAVRGAVAHAHASDAFVGAVLIVWWVIAPAVSDDGWVVSRLRLFPESEGFSAYYNSFGANQPLGFWLEWTQHALSQMSTALLVLRVPALLCLAATWLLCRWIFARAATWSVTRGRATHWTLACAFTVGVFAWGMTIRPEPVVALLITAVVACTVRFLEKPSPTPLVVAAILIALAVSAHPAGILSVAPLLVTAPTLTRWARTQLAVAATLTTSAVALLMVLLFVGSDLQSRASDARTFRMFGDATSGWRDEVTRYASMSGSLYATPARRAAVALMLLAVLAYLLRPRARGHVVLDLPGGTLAVALVLLIATPSKWPFHFGALLGVTALALASETTRLRLRADRSRGLQPLPFLVIAAAAVAAAWAWWPRGSWNDLDLRTSDWTFAFESSEFSLSNLAAVIPLLLLLVTAGLAALVPGQRNRLRDAPWRVAAWTVPAVVVPVVAFTAAVLVVDVAKAQGWTLARQNLEALRGDEECGLADDLLIAVNGSMQPLPSADKRDARPVSPWVPQTPIGGLKRIAYGFDSSRSVRSAWFELPARAPVGLFLTGMRYRTDTVVLEWGRRHTHDIEVLGSGEVFTDFRAEVGLELRRWRFVAAEELPAAHRLASLVRVKLETKAAPGAAVAVTAPVSYSNERLAGLLRRERGPALVHPNLLMYVPCVQQPRLTGGAVEVPARILVTAEQVSWPLGSGKSPFDGLFDLYDLDWKPLVDPQGRVGEAAVYELNLDIPGATLAPANRVTFDS